MGEKLSTSSSVDYMTDISTEMNMPIGGHKLTVTGTGGIYFKSHTSILNLSINLLMYRSINRRKYIYINGRNKHKKGHISSTKDSSIH